MQVYHSGYYKWLITPISNREIENQQLIVHIKNAFKESSGIYGYRNIHKDLKESGMQSIKNELQDS
jgi:putative transposase